MGLSDKKIKYCPACGQAFECGSQDCWCSRYNLPDSTLRYLEAEYDDCLCPACLTGDRPKSEAKY